jgi:antitoxin component YwqK of YwqJK toxin-antitoxin module
MTTHTDRLIKNVSHWAPYCPKQSSQLLELVPKSLTLCQAANGELNLKCSIDGKEQYYHSMESPSHEADQCFQSLDLHQVKVLFVYGVGLGYAFQAARQWLDQSKEHVIVFLEDDIEVVYYLFDTELGKELLTHKQAQLYFLEKDQNGNFIEESFTTIPSLLFLPHQAYSYLSLYQELYPQLVSDCEKYLGYFKNYNTYQTFEQLTYGRKFFTNYYRNLLDLPHSKFADRMFGRFKGIPAIICGAGPSLEKNRALLEQLNDKALVIAGGSAMNAVNANGWLPHFGVAIDPNLSQYSRLFMNQAYEVPFFYRNRVFPEALRLLHGEHLYVSGSGGYGIASWFEQELGIEGTEIEEGTNVVNFGIAIAEALGCNPIILVGCDMAYTGNKSYAKGINPHPILDLNQAPSTRYASDEMIDKNDIFGNTVQTLWKWVTESVWISQFAITHPNVQIYNATEGGIGVEAVKNVQLDEMDKDYLSTMIDMNGLIHQRIHESAFGKDFDKDMIAGRMLELKESMERAKQHCKILMKEFADVLATIKETEDTNPKLITDKALDALKELNQETAFTTVLSKFNESFLSFYGREDMETLHQERDKRIDQKEINLRRTRLNRKRYKFLEEVAQANLERISATLKEDQIRTLITQGLSVEQSEESVALSDDVSRALDQWQSQTYLFENERYRVEDKDLGVQFEGRLFQEPVVRVQLEGEGSEFADFTKNHPEFTGKLELVRCDGTVAMEHFYESGILHGPAIGYFSDGQVSSRCFYQHGLKQGKVVCYFPTGSLFSLTGFKEGKREGTQEYFYPNGSLKSAFNYLNGRLDGPIAEYFPNRVMKRKLSYLSGNRHGKEVIWNLGGIKEIEINYSYDKPVGFAKSWHLNGQLAREVFYDEEGKLVYVHGFTSDGVELPTDLMMREDYFEKVSQQAGTLTGSIEDIIGHVGKVVPLVKDYGMKEENSDYASDMRELQEEMGKLREIYQKIESYGEETSEEAKEALWKTPETQRILGKQIDQIADKMADDLGSIKHTLKLMDQLLKHQSEDKNSS